MSVQTPQRPHQRQQSLRSSITLDLSPDNRKSAPGQHQHPRFPLKAKRLIKAKRLLRAQASEGSDKRELAPWRWRRRLLRHHMWRGESVRGAGAEVLGAPARSGLSDEFRQARS